MTVGESLSSSPVTVTSPVSLTVGASPMSVVAVHVQRSVKLAICTVNVPSSSVGTPNSGTSVVGLVEPVIEAVTVSEPSRLRITVTVALAPGPRLDTVMRPASSSNSISAPCVTDTVNSHSSSSRSW